MDAYFEITATGDDEFPFDMLRFARCWPVGIEDAAKMGNEHSEKHRSIRLALDGGILQAESCVDRFASFGWSAEISHAPVA